MFTCFMDNPKFKGVSEKWSAPLRIYPATFFIKIMAYIFSDVDKTWLIYLNCVQNCGLFLCSSGVILRSSHLREQYMSM